MENENKDMQKSVEELEEQVRQDISDKIADAAAELQDEIQEAAEESAEEVLDAMDVDQEDLEDLDALEEAPKKEPKIVTVKLRNWILSLVGTAVLGALLLLLGMQIPAWIEQMPEGSTVMTVDGYDITDLDMEYYIYEAASQYLVENTLGGVENPAEYDWDQTVEDGRVLRDVIYENAIKNAQKEGAMLSFAERRGIVADASQINSLTMQNEQLIAMYGEELVLANVQRQGLASVKQYVRKVEQTMILEMVDEELVVNYAEYTPEDISVLYDFASDDGVTYRAIIIDKTEEAEDPGLAAGNLEKAQEALARIESGEDFDTVYAEFNEDVNQPLEGYTLSVDDYLSVPAEEALGMEMNEISGLVDSEDGHYIIKRIPGAYENKEYLASQADVSVKEKKIKKISIEEVFAKTDAATETFNTLYAEVSAQ